MRGLANARAVRRGVKLARTRSVTVELHLAVEWGASIPQVGREVQQRVRDYLRQMADVDAARSTSWSTRSPDGGAPLGAHPRDAADDPSVCHACVWWQSRGGRATDKDRWMDRIEDDWGAWGTVYRDEHGNTLGSMQYGPAELFPRAAELPAGPPSEDAVLVTCAYLVASSSPWVMQSLFLAAIGDARDKGARALEAFAYRYAEGECAYERFQVHKTIFPRDFLSDFGFVTVRSSRSGSSSRGSSSAGFSRSPKARAPRCCASSRRRSSRNRFRRRGDREAELSAYCKEDRKG